MAHGYHDQINRRDLVLVADQVPIFVDEAVLDEAGVLFEAEEDEEQIEQFREFLDQISPEDFA